MKEPKEILNEYGEPVFRSRISRVLRVIVITFVVALNLFLILRTFAACDAPISNQMLYSATLQKNLAAAALKLPVPQGFSSCSARRKQAQGISLLNLHSSSAVEDNGHLQIKNVTYLDGAKNLQLTMKQNSRYYPLYNENGHLTLSYLVRVIDEKGNASYCNTTLTRTKSEERFGYAYTRVSFDDLEINVGTDYVTLYVFLTDELDQTVLALTISSQSMVTSQKELSSADFIAL